MGQAIVVCPGVCQAEKQTAKTRPNGRPRGMSNCSGMFYPAKYFGKPTHLVPWSVLGSRHALIYGRMDYPCRPKGCGEYDYLPCRCAYQGDRHEAIEQGLSYVIKAPSIRRLVFIYPRYQAPYQVISSFEKNPCPSSSENNRPVWKKFNQRKRNPHSRHS